ncbi:MAG: hypothetical protein KF716_31830 [Anaerolineae bacterium]|nr:hypothetical protein [Anaerolineae bacterium]
MELSASDKAELRRLARQTWLFYEQMVGPEDHWLPPDHYQEAPCELVAHRTSPTNIGMLMLSTLSAYDLGFMGPLELIVRLQATLATFDQLEHYRGHLLNWYDTQTLEPLTPRYVSTVDSGNLAGALIAIKQACLGFPAARVMTAQRWHGFLDTLDLVEGSVNDLLAASPDAPASSLQKYTATLRQKVQAAALVTDQWASLTNWLAQDAWAEFSRLMIDLLSSDAVVPDPDKVKGLRIVSERLHQHILYMHSDVDQFTPWLMMLYQPPAYFTQPDCPPALLASWKELRAVLPTSPALRDLAAICDQADAHLKTLRAQLLTAPGTPDQLRAAQTWCSQLQTKISVTRQHAEALLNDVAQIARDCQRHFAAMNFDFLYNHQRKLFYIGYNVTAERLDDNCYDLLASEARLASLLAIAKRDVPQEHWLHLGRAMTTVVNTRTLLSWSGTMFEYLMPTLLMRGYEHTLLNQSNRAAVDYQIAYAQERNVPWGISESSYYAFDGSMTYQYRAFGVPGLGFKRGLTEDLVIAPYASLLALALRPDAVRHNMDRLADVGMRGRYGFYESVDYSRARLIRRQDHAIIRSYMAHHQGMIMVALTNYLTRDVMIERFHADPTVQSVEMLLQERIPTQAPVEFPHQDELTAHTTRQTRVSLHPWSVPVDAPVPQVHVLSNGHYSTLITSAGGGYSQWNGVALTRWQSDTTRDHWGIWLYVQDLDSGALWSASYQPTALMPESQSVAFYPHQAEFQRRDNQIALHMQVTVSAEDDVEIRQLTIINHGERPRRLRVVSYGEVALAPTEPHPAFNKLFIESEYVADRHLLLFHRRLRAADETPIYFGHFLVTDDRPNGTLSYEGDRARFLGRGSTPFAPQALQRTNARLSQTVGITLDPIMSLSQEVVVQPHGRARMAYLTLATDARQAALDLATRYQTWTTITRAFDDSLRQNESMLRQLDLGTSQLTLIQQLLSLLLYPHHSLRAATDVLSSNIKGQSALWAYAISGDYPILLVRIRAEADLGLVQELLQAHTYWRDQQLKIDLVIVNLHDSSYSQELQGQLHRLIVRANSALWLNQRGGIFTVNADQMGKGDYTLLQTAARVVLDGQQGTLTEQLTRAAQAAVSPLPAFTPSLFNPDAVEATPPLPRPADLRFDNGTGGFTSDGSEYVVYLDADHWTPVPWVNIIANDSFGFLVSEAGSSYTWAGNSSQNRLTPWHNDPVSDGAGEAIYLRDEETAKVWSPTPLPSRDSEPYLIRHGAGYSVFDHHSQGVKQTTTYFTAPDAPVKIIKLRVENLWQRPRRLTVTYYAEWVLEVSRANAQSYIILDYDHSSGALLARNPYNTEFADRVAFLAANKAPHGLTADRTEFIGRMGNLYRPAALNRIGLASRVECGGDPCAALQLHIDLPVGGVEEVYFILGEGADKDDALTLIQRFQQPDQVAAAWHGTHEFWDRVLGTVTVHTPDPALDIMLNRWLLYQALSCRIWGRSGFYQSSGAYGYRDQLQDVMALVHAAPDLTKQQILRAARHQFEAGDVLHWWHPPSGRGVRTRFSDDLLWLPFVVATYINATGDKDILREQLPFLRGTSLKANEEERYGQYETTAETYSLYEHCIRAVKRGSTAGAHGLPLMGTGDWNDGMNRVGREGRGESVWVGWFLYSVLTSLAPLCEWMEDTDRATAYRQQAEQLKATLNQTWDGTWYLRAYYDDGTPLGSARNQECQIDSIAQSWAVISGAGDSDRSAQAMQAVEDRLIREKDGLVLLFTPPFDKSPRDPGYIKGYPPGVRENGGQYTHAALWVVWAFAQLGDGDRAGALFNLINPIGHSDTPEKSAIYKVEPYVIAADVYGVAPHTGRGGWTWYTGSASWMYRLGIEAILGLKRMGDKLAIDPSIPSAWSSYDLTYRNGGARYHIHIANPENVSHGVIEVLLDGNSIPDLHIPLSDGGDHEVHVKLGRATPDASTEIQESSATRHAD